jgi:hypothetical protein
MDKPPDRPIERLTEPLAQQDTHLSDEILLLSVDGELALRDVAQVKAHLEACWSCRTRRDQVEESIAEVVEYRDLLLKPYLPPSRAGRSMFLGRLDELGKEIGRPTFWTRLTGLFHSSTIAFQRPAWITGLALLCILLLLFAEFHGSAIVSASEVMKRSDASEKQLLRKTAALVIYQKLQIRSSGRLLTRILYRDPSNNREIETETSDRDNGPLGLTDSSLKTTSPGSPTGLRTDIQEEFEQAHLNWKNPLSADSFQAWHRQLENSIDEVTKPDGGLLSIRTKMSEGPVIESTFTVRASDYHPIAETFTLKNKEQIEIIETAFEVISLDAINPSLLVFKGQPEKPVDHVAASTPTPSVITPEQLTQIELQARLALHMTGADLGEQIEIGRNPNSAVVIQGLAASEVRRKEILAALQGIPNVDMRLQTVSEVTAADRLPQPPYGDNAVLVEAEPFLQEELEEKFPTVEERKSYVDSVLSSSGTAMANVWALRRLESRFAAQDVAGLNTPSRQMLELLIREHIGAIRQEVGTEARLVETVLPRSSLPDTSPNSIPQCSGSNWRDATDHLFRCLGEIQEGTALLLAGSASTAQDQKDTSRRVSETLAALQAQIPCLYQQVSGDFLLKTDRADQ